MEEMVKFFKKIIGEIDIETRKGLKSLTAVVVLLEGLFYTHFFIFPYNLFGGWKDYIIYIVFPIILYLIQILLFGSDDLYYGNPIKNKYAAAFQAFLPSKHIATKYSITSDQAESFWFEKCFNPLKDPNHPRHEQRERTFTRGFSCRFIYYFIKTLQYILILAVGTIILQEIFPILMIKAGYPKFRLLIPDISYTGRISFIIINLLLLLITKKRNKVNIGSFSGVWRRFEEINKLHISWIDDNFKTIDDFNNK